MKATAYQDLWHIAENHLKTAKTRRSWPPIHPKALRLFRLLGPRPTTLYELQKATGLAIPDIRDAVENLAFALLIYAPYTMRINRGRDTHHRHGGSTPHQYWIVPAR